MIRIIVPLLLVLLPASVSAAEIVREFTSLGEYNVMVRIDGEKLTLHFHRQPTTQDRDARIAECELRIVAEKKQAEIEANIDSIISGDGNLTFLRSTPNENAVALRRRYRASRGLDASRIARWVYLNLSVAQIKSIWGLSDAQVSALRTKWATLIEQLNAAEAVAGE